MKNRFLIIFGIFATLLSGLYIASLLVILISDMFDHTRYALVTILTVLTFSVFVIGIAAGFYIKRKRESIRRSFDSYIDKSVSTVGVGLIIFNDSSEIIWVSKFMEQRLNKRLVGKRLHSLSDSFQKKFESGKSVFRFNIHGIVFLAQIDFENQTITLKDVTNEDTVMKQHEAGRTVLGELEIDNFQQLQLTLPEDKLFKVQSSVIKMLDALVEKYNIVYRQYVNGKYLIYTTNEVLQILIEDRFTFFDSIRNIQVGDGVYLSASLGMGSGSSELRELSEYAKDALAQALARGGDQVSVIVSNEKPVYFGSKKEGAKTSSKVKIKKVASLFEAKLKSEEIKNVIIYGHQYADLDAVGAALGVKYAVSKYGKNGYIQNVTFDSTTQSAIDTYLTKEDKASFISKSRAISLAKKSDTMVVIVDTAELHRIENNKALDSVKEENIFIFDHHRVSELPKGVAVTNTYIATSASPASEIISEVIQFMSKRMKPTKSVAQMLLNGIYLDTGQFSKSTSSRTFAAASWLETFGATSDISSTILKLPEKYSKLVSSIVSSVKEVKEGYFLSSYEGEVSPDIISLAADEILRVQGRKAAFVIAKLPKSKMFKLSARGVETNVQVIAESVGGGGHFASAAATSSEPLPVFVDNIIHSIVSIKGEK